MFDNYENDKVSVIIPLYNNEKYIVNCIDSVLNQKYKNIEIIIVDDGSTDNSYELVKNKYKNNEIIFIKQTNKGPSAARNKGITYATGKWIMFLDSDDRLEKRAIEVAITNSKDVDLVVGGWNGVYSNKIEYYGPKVSETLTGWQIKDLATYLLSNGIMFTSSNSRIPSIEGPVAKLYLTKVIKENNIMFPGDLQYAEDVVFNYNYLQLCRKVKIISVSLYEANRHQGSLSNRKLNLIEIYRSFKKNIINLNVKEWDIDNPLLCRKLIWIITDLEKEYKSLTFKNAKSYFTNHNLESLREVSIENLSIFKKIEYFGITSNYLSLYFVIKIGCFIKGIKNRHKYIE